MHRIGLDAFKFNFNALHIFSTHIFKVSAMCALVFSEIQIHLCWLLGAYAGGYFAHKKPPQPKPLIIKSDRNSHESREWFAYKLGMALDWKMYSVFVFYLFWNAWCHSESWYRAQTVGAGILSFGFARVSLRFASRRFKAAFFSPLFF